jgi:hypothetical protein
MSAYYELAGRFAFVPRTRDAFAFEIKKSGYPIIIIG